MKSQKIDAWSGSLVVAVPCEQGLLVMSDRRSKDALRGITDESTKIAQITPTTLAASTGTTAFANFFSNDGKIRVSKPFFDATSEVEAWAKRHKGKIDLDTVKDSIAQAVEQGFKDKFNGRLPPCEKRTTDLFQCIVFNYNHALQRFEYCRIHFDYDYPTNSATGPGTLRHQLPISCTSQFDVWQSFGEDLFSKTAVAKMSEAKKADLRNDKILFGKYLPPVSLTAAKHLAAHVVKVTSRSLPKDTPNPVGKTVDVILLTKDGCSPISRNSVFDFDPEV